MIWRGLSRYVVLSLCAVLLSATFGTSVIADFRTMYPDTDTYTDDGSTQRGRHMWRMQHCTCKHVRRRSGQALCGY